MSAPLSSITSHEQQQYPICDIYSHLESHSNHSSSSSSSSVSTPGSEDRDYDSDHHRTFTTATPFTKSLHGPAHGHGLSASPLELDAKGGIRRGYFDRKARVTSRSAEAHCHGRKRCTQHGEDDPIRCPGQYEESDEITSSGSDNDVESLTEAMSGQRIDDPQNERGSSSAGRSVSPHNIPLPPTPRILLGPQSAPDKSPSPLNTPLSRPSSQRRVRGTDDIYQPSARKPRWYGHPGASMDIELPPPDLSRDTGTTGVGAIESPIPPFPMTVDNPGEQGKDLDFKFEGKRTRERRPSSLERHLSWVAKMSSPVTTHPSGDTPPRLDYLKEPIVDSSTLTDEETRGDNIPPTISRGTREREMRNTLETYLTPRAPTPPMPDTPVRQQGSGYDTDSTLELESENETEEEFSRDNSLAPVEGEAAPVRDVKPPGIPLAQTKKAKYTHGHELQRMPGQVKGFGAVPHFHHQLHGTESGTESEGSASDIYVDEDTSVESEDVGGLDDDHRGSAKKTKSNLGPAFLSINMNITETGRDVRVLVRSKQIIPKNILGCTVGDFEKIIEELIVEEPLLFEEVDDEYHRKLIMHPHENPKFMIKRLPLSSTELLVLLELNHADVRNAAWNPAPHVICAVDRPRPTHFTGGKTRVDACVGGNDDDDVFLFFEPLREAKNNPWLQTVADYLDAFKELLEGLTFLHEHRIAGVRASLARSFMRTTDNESDVGDAPRQLRYKFVDFAEVQRLAKPPSPQVRRTSIRQDRRSVTPTVPPEQTNDEQLIRRDVQDLSAVFRRILANRIPQVRAWFNPLVESMANGALSANQARLLLAELTNNLKIVSQMKDDEFCAEGERRMKGVLSTKARPESAIGGAGADVPPSPRIPAGWRSRSGRRQALDHESERLKGKGVDGTEFDVDAMNGRACYYYESGEDSDDPNDTEEEREEEGGGQFMRGRSGTIMAKSAIPAL